MPAAAEGSSSPHRRAGCPLFPGKGLDGCQNRIDRRVQCAACVLRRIQRKAENLRSIFTDACGGSAALVDCVNLTAGAGNRPFLLRFPDGFLPSLQSLLRIRSNGLHGMVAFNRPVRAGPASPSRHPPPGGNGCHAARGPPTLWRSAQRFQWLESCQKNRCRPK